jgi:hypothetical protein
MSQTENPSRRHPILQSLALHPHWFAMVSCTCGMHPVLLTCLLVCAFAMPLAHVRQV